jgi:renin receptor
MAVVGVAVNVFFIFALSLDVISGDYVILRSPKHVHFLPDALPIETSEISPLTAASFGLQLNRDLKWNGMEEGSLFQRPKASAIISIAALPSGHLDDVPNVASYKTVESDYSDVNTEDLASLIERIDWNADPLVVDFAADGNMFDVRTGHSDVFANVPSTLGALSEDAASGVLPRWFSATDLVSLNVSNDVDLRFIGELYVMQEIVNTMLDNMASVKTNSPDFFHFHVVGLEQLARTYGLESVQFGDAVKLLKTALGRVSDGLEKAYAGNVVVQVVTFSPQSSSQKTNVRRARSLLAAADTAAPAFKASDLGLAPKFSRSYSAIFNICLWTMVAFGLAIFFVSWGIWHMDPGRDSIIYRMTSTRMKRD